MNSPEILYQKVYSSLNSFNEELKHVKNSRILVTQECKEKCVNAENNMEERLKANALNEMKIKAYIEIARNHSLRLEEATQEIPFDATTLSRLAVQINNSLKNDAFANQLYTQSTGQLRAIRNKVHTIQNSCEEIKLEIKRQAQLELINLEKKQEQLMSEIFSYFYSEEFKKFVNAIQLDYTIFGKHENDVECCFERINCISFGTKQVMLPVPSGFEELVVKETQGLYDYTTSLIGIPIGIDMMSGTGIVIEYRNETEKTLLNGLQNFLVNTARYFDDLFEQIIYVDPVRLNNSSLGILQPLAVGAGTFIDSVPHSIDEAKKKVSAVIENVNEQDLMVQTNKRKAKRILIFHNYPQGYDSLLCNQIQQLIVNATHYNYTVIVTHNCSIQNTLSADSLEYIKTVTKSIGCDEDDFYVVDTKGKAAFRWYHAPDSLPEDIKCKYENYKSVVDISNNYERRIGFSSIPTYIKGTRQLINIPYGIDGDGNIQSLDFENSNFATFICGAARSGKSTLLHTLITGIIANNHPDDVELWLIDFKMTEFSRYIKHLPPHVRYIILDESPELVYDIIDRLTEILTKRQMVFKGKWQKLSEVPSEKYMPAIFVIIDEFSVMSQIIADSSEQGKENYSLKLQTLLAKGAALGLHFIFASQGFTSGTRGLNDFSKKQIQQRIAMKTEFYEIKETLDLKSASDEDKDLMERLQVHYALTRLPVDAKGNHLLLSKVLFIQDYEKQEAMIDMAKKLIAAAPKYDVNNTAIYIDKKALIVDGNNYLAFDSKQSEMREYLHKKSDFQSNEGEAILFLGEPRRMMSLYAIEILRSFCENMLIIAPVNEKMAVTSVLMSIAGSLEMEGKGMEFWTTKKNNVYRQMSKKIDCKNYSLSQDLEEVCYSIKRIKEKIHSKVEGDHYIVLLGFEILLLDMKYLEGEGSTTGDYKGTNKMADLIIEKREEDELDIISQLNMLSGNTNVSCRGENKIGEKEEDIRAITAPKEKEVYDARMDLEYILTQGPRMGYHFIMVFNTVGELNQGKINHSLFKHKILFRLPRIDAAEIVDSSNSKAISELENHSFRYTDGLNALSFRPYLHPGLSWDGWQMIGNSAVNIVDEEEEYLM